jgi:pyruvate/2-oxoglutarate dehydrogenase complex dihydrolipoamide dehydrogenase (E3) component
MPLRHAAILPMLHAMSSQAYDFDVAIIGAGSGGYAAARATASAGLSTAVIEGGKDVGGLCILRGCMPTKALLHASDVLHLARKAETWGIKTAGVSFDFARVMARKESMINEFADYRRQQLSSGNFKFIRASAHFLDAHTVQLATGEKLTARHFIISTGSTVAPPPLPQLSEAGYITSDDALSLKELPKSMIVLGGGAVAVEFAQFFARFDVEVTLVQRSGHILRDFDQDAAEELEKVLEREGIKLYHNTRLTDAQRTGASKSVSFLCAGKPVTLEAESILFALGRVANTHSVGLDKAGVLTEGTRVCTNSEMQTNVPHIFAAGDCTGPHEIVHIAIQQGEVAAHNILHPEARRRMDYRLLTSVVFTDPQVATTGLTEKEAQLRGIRYLCARYRFDDHGKSLIMEARDGFVKLLCEPLAGEILGAAVVGPFGGELIHEIIAAMHKRMTVHELAAMPHYHPTLAEIWTYPAEELASQITLPSKNL